MRKVVLAMFISLDGFIEGRNKQLMPPAYSADLDRYWIKANTDNAGTMMYGRVCYEGMVAYWTSKEAAGPVATALAQKPKIVFSRTLQKADWANTTIVRDDIAGTINALKQQDGGELTLIGGAGIANAFIRLGLIDEYRLLVTPIVFGGGTPLFQGGTDRFDLALDNARTLDNGAVLLIYRKAEKS